MKSLIILLSLMSTVSTVSGSDLEEIRKAVIHPVVRVRVGNSSGSGTAIKELSNGNTLVLTNWHVVSDHVDRTSRIIEGGSPWLKTPLITVEKFIWDERGISTSIVRKDAELVFYDRSQDLALLEVDLDLPITEVATIEEMGTLQTLQKVLAVGCPLGDQPTLTGGLIVGLDSNIGGHTGMISMTSPIIFGNSGGALYAQIDGKWKLIGVPTMIKVAYGNAVPYLASAVSVVQVLKLLKRCENEKYSGCSCRDVGFGKDDCCACSV